MGVREFQKAKGKLFVKKWKKKVGGGGETSSSENQLR